VQRATDTTIVQPLVNHSEQDISVTPPLISCLLVIGRVVPCGVGQVNQNNLVLNRERENTNGYERIS
jgi:hypothetical protein